MKHLHVACGIIERKGYVLSTQRSKTMSLPLKWEFPGGKVDEGESIEDCLKRELFEELAIDINIHSKLTANSHKYPQFMVTLYPFICTIHSGEIILKEHANFRWLQPCDLLTLDWAAADIPIVKEYCNRLANL